MIEGEGSGYASPFRARFDQLAVYENRRTPVLLLEDEYNRAKLRWETHAELVSALRDVIGWVPLGPTHWHTQAAAQSVDRARAILAKTQGAA